MERKALFSTWGVLGSAREPRTPSNDLVARVKSEWRAPAVYRDSEMSLLTYPDAYQSGGDVASRDLTQIWSSFKFLRFQLKRKLEIDQMTLVEDAVNLHNTYLHLEEILENSSGNTEEWNGVRDTVLQKVEEIKSSVKEQPLKVFSLVRELTNYVSSIQAADRPSPSPLPNAAPFPSAQTSDLSKMLHADLFTKQAWHESSVPLDDYLNTISRMCHHYEIIARPKVEQDMVGFGLDEILGIRLRKKPDWRSKPYEKFPVFYATNREHEGKLDKLGDVFGNKLNKELSFGVTQVPCPEGKPQVKREEQVAEMMLPEAFKKTLKEAIDKDDRKGVLLYVHGCFSDFGRSMGYGAQISRGLDFEGPICVYSWPTVGRPPVSVGLGVIDMYRKDEQTSVQSASHLKDTIRMLARDVGAENVHIVAYSMGARTLLEAMRLLGAEDLGSNLGVKTHIYFMAPDVPAKFFSEVARKFRTPVPRPRPRPPSPEGPQAEPGTPESPETLQAGSSRNCEDPFVEDLVGPIPPSPISASPADPPAVPVDWGVLLEQLADSVEDAVLALRNFGQVWRQGRSVGWPDILKSVFGPEEEAGPRGDQGTVPGARRNAFVHLYAAQNDVALLLSELMDRGSPQIRAGRRTSDFLLCNDGFDTIDASALKTGLLTTGHFYLFHSIVRADMRHVVEGAHGLPWWRQVERWRSYRYWKLRHQQGDGAGQRRSSEEGEGAPSVYTSALYWNSA